jgi:hypothetical protein
VKEIFETTGAERSRLLLKASARIDGAQGCVNDDAADMAGRKSACRWAITKLCSEYARNYWNDTGYFLVSGNIMRQIVRAGLAETRKRSASAPAEYRSKINRGLIDAWGGIDAVVDSVRLDDFIPPAK